MDEAPPVVPEVPTADPAAKEVPTAPSTAAAPGLSENYHVALWTSPPSYLCLRCYVSDLPLPDIQAHVRTVHGEEPRPTVLAADVTTTTQLTRMQEEPHGGEPAVGGDAPDGGTAAQ